MRLAQCNTQAKSRLLLLSVNTEFGLSCIDLTYTSSGYKRHSKGQLGCERLQCEGWQHCSKSGYYRMQRQQVL